MDNSFEKAIKKGETWEKRKENLLESLDKKVDVVSGVMKMARRMEKYQDKEAIENIPKEIDLHFDKIFKEVPEEILNKQKEIKKFTKEFLRLGKELRRPGITDKEFAELQSAYQSIYIKKKEMEEDPDIYFLKNLKNWEDKIKNKVYSISEFKNNREIIDEADAILEEKLQTNIDRFGVLSVEKKNFHITITLDEQAFNDLFIIEGVQGMRIKDSHFIFINEKFKSIKKEIERHESVHNMLDGVEAIKDKYAIVDNFLNDLKYLESGNRNKERKILDSEIYLDNLHNEILAQYEFAEQLNFTYGITKPDYLPSEMDQDKILIAQSMGTAGFVSADMLYAIDEAMEKYKNNKEIIRSLDNFKKEFSHKFFKAIENIQHSLMVAEKIKEKNTREIVESLFYILRPSQYGHIKRYLKYRYGEEVDGVYKEIEKEEENVKKK